MPGKETPWKLDRPYDPDERAADLRRRFSRYRTRTGASGAPRRLRFLPLWLLIVAAIGALIVFAI
jgi:hypothetical protein